MQSTTLPDPTLTTTSIAVDDGGCLPKDCGGYLAPEPATALLLVVPLVIVLVMVRRRSRRAA